MTAPKPNAELAYRVLDHIDAHPESWIQKTWWCGTGGCFAGWTAELSGEHPLGRAGVLASGMHVGDRAAELLGFDSQADLDAAGFAATYPDGLPDEGELGQEYELFSAINTREDLGRLVGEIFGPRPGGAS